MSEPWRPTPERPYRTLSVEQVKDAETILARAHSGYLRPCGDVAEPVDEESP
jgi:hypothetical protein